MAVVTVTDSFTEITDGNETTDTLVQIGKNMRVTFGGTSGRTYSNATPMNFGQIVIVPAGVVCHMIAVSGQSWPAWKETGFS
jgi:hypothetical protein